MTATITVQGRSVASAEPDDAQLSFTLSALHATPEQALADVADRSKTLAGIFVGCRIPEGDRITSGIAVRPKTEWQNSRHVHRGYLATTSVIVRLDDADLIGRLMNDAIQDVGAEVSGPRWRVAADNPAHTQARTAAVADARRRADAYAEALGVRLGAVVEVSEPGLRNYSTPSDSADLVLASARPGAELEVEAGNMDITCSIDVVYSLEQ